MCSVISSGVYVDAMAVNTMPLNSEYSLLKSCGCVYANCSMVLEWLMSLSLFICMVCKFSTQGGNEVLKKCLVGSYVTNGCNIVVISHFLFNGIMAGTILIFCL